MSVLHIERYRIQPDLSPEKVIFVKEMIIIGLLAGIGLLVQLVI